MNEILENKESKEELAMKNQQWIDETEEYLKDKPNELE